MANRHKKMVAAEAKLITKQQNEMGALKKRIESGEHAQRKQREQEHNKLAEVPELEEGIGKSAKS